MLATGLVKTGTQLVEIAHEMGIWELGMADNRLKTRARISVAIAWDLKSSKNRFTVI